MGKKDKKDDEYSQFFISSFSLCIFHCSITIRKNKMNIYFYLAILNKLPLNSKSEKGDGDKKEKKEKKEKKDKKEKKEKKDKKEEKSGMYRMDISNLFIMQISKFYFAITLDNSYHKETI